MFTSQRVGNFRPMHANAWLLRPVSSDDAFESRIGPKWVKCRFNEDLSHEQLADGQGLFKISEGHVLFSELGGERSDLSEIALAGSLHLLRSFKPSS